MAFFFVEFACANADNDEWKLTDAKTNPKLIAIIKETVIIFLMLIHDCIITGIIVLDPYYEIKI